MTNLHVVFLPFFTSSHITPLVHAARLFASRGVRSTIITTFHTAKTFQDSVDRDASAGHPITVHTLTFPSSEVGLPVGMETVNSTPSSEMALAIFHAMMLLKPPMEQAIRDLAPDCIFSDSFFPWTVDLADELNIPRLVFHPTSVFQQCLSHILALYKPHEKVESESESFVFPNFPDKITKKRSQLEDFDVIKAVLGDLFERMAESVRRSYGLVHNTFYEMEPAYVDYYKKITDAKVWHIGPLFQIFNSDDGNRNVSENQTCLSWLDGQKPKSVIYVSFGSLVKFLEAQITEIALALEEAKRPFIWVVGKTGNEGIRGLPEGFEERVKSENKGLIITGWAPQVAILNHYAVGGFMTPCGNSVLEAVVAGVPLEITSPTIGKLAIKEAIELLTSESVVAESIRKNSKELAIKRKKAIKEGGSSVNNLTALIRELKTIKSASKL